MNEIGKYIAGPHRRQLVDIPDNYQGCARRHSPKKIIHQKGIDHGSFIQHNHISFKGTLFIPLKTALLPTEFKHSVNGLSVLTGSLLHAF